MKIQPFIIGLIIGALAAFGLTRIFIANAVKNTTANINTSNVATNNPDSIKWQWADSLDAVKAAPKSHRIIFENDKIRILEVILQPFTQEPMHTHKWPSVMFGNNNNDDTSHFDIVYNRYDYDSINHTYFVKKSITQHNGGQRKSDNDEGHYMKPEGPHSIKNLSKVKIDVYRIEFKPDSGKVK